MKSLALYIDKWYIVGAISVDGNTRPVKLPNNEDRIWLYFHEDIANDTVSYGKGFKSHYWNRENHYYGDIFANLTNSAARFTMFKHSQPIKDIFKMGKVFDDLKAAIDNENDIPTYLSFSKDITPSARLIFRKELEEEGFQIEESVARIDHLALEYAVKKNGFSDEGHYLVLNACNENLHYSIYKKSGDIFLRMADSVLSGMGTDLRRRCLIEHVVDSINQTERFLQTKDEIESEYLRCSQFVDDWVLKISNAHLHIPVQITDVTLSKDPHKTYNVGVKRIQIDKKTEVVAKNLVDEIVRFVRENGVRHEEMSGIVYLGNTFTNKQFTSQFLNYYNLQENRMICYMDKDLSMLVSAYNFIDCSQFNELESKFTANAEDELHRLKIAEEERIANEKAQAEAEEIAKITQAKKEEEAKFRQAMDRGYESESDHNYDKMFEYFEIATKLRPDDEEANSKCEEARRLKAEQSVKQKTYKEKLQQAKTALDEKDWELAKQKAEEALSYSPESKEARHIKDEANRQITQQKDFDRYIDRTDFFIAKKLYKEATEELEKARLLSIDDKAVKSRFDKIKELQNAFKSKIDNLAAQLKIVLSNKDYTEAILVCNELREEDPANQIKWTNKLTEINSLQQGEKEREEKIKTLKSEIDTAQWKDDWKTVADKCKKLLKLSTEDGIKEKLAVAERKLRVIEEKAAIEKAISEIKDLIVRAEFKDAKTKLDLLSKGYVNDSMQEVADKIGNSETGKALGLGGAFGAVGKFISKASETFLPPSNLVKEPEIQNQIRELRKLLFAREAEFESKHTTPKTAIQVTSGDEPSESSEKKSTTQSSRNAEFGTTNFDDFFGDSKKGQVPAKQKPPKKPAQDVDDFFGEASKAVKKASDTIKKATKGFDDFFNS